MFQSSLPRLFSRTDQSQHSTSRTGQSQDSTARTDQSRHSTARTDQSRHGKAQRSSSAVVYSHQSSMEDIDLQEFHASPPGGPLYRPQPRSSVQATPSSPSKSSLGRKIDKLFSRRRSLQSESPSGNGSSQTSTPSASPRPGWRWPSPGRVRRDSKDSKDSKESRDSKDGGGKKKFPSRRRYEEITAQEMLSVATTTSDVTMTSSVNKAHRTGARAPVKCDIPTVPPSNGEGQGQGRARLKLPSTPVQAPPTSPGAYVRIQLTANEQALVDRRYDDVTEVANDVTRLMTSSIIVTCDVTASAENEVTTSFSENEVTADGSGLGSTEAVLSAGPAESGSVEEVGHESGSVLPAVRRFIALCDRVSVAATCGADRVDDFADQLTASVRALIALRAVTRRRAATCRTPQQLNDALGHVTASYVAMVTAAGPAVGLSADEAVVVEASRRAAELAQQLSTFLTTLKNIRPVVLL